jgi:hypothetical protein
VTERPSLLRAIRRVARTWAGLAAIVGALIAIAALGGSVASSAATSSGSSNAVVFPSLDRFRAEVPNASLARQGAARDEALSPRGPGWEPAGSLNNARSRLSLAYFPFNGRFYALGGESTGGNRAIPIEEYRPATNTWTDRAMLNPGVSDTGAARVGNYIYVPGGLGGVPAVGRTEMQRYDPVANTVTQVAPLPTANFSHGVAAQGTKIYVLGGPPQGSQGRRT